MIEIEQNGNVALLRMVHGKANAMDLAFCEGLIAALKRVQAEPTVAAIVLTGRGKIFSAGVDLPRLLEEDEQYTRAFVKQLSRMFEAVFFHPKPIVAAINGHAIAGGCILACATDYRIMVDEGSKIGIPELFVGVPFPTTALEIMRFVLAQKDFQHLIYHGQISPPQKAFSIGLLEEMKPHAEVEACALKHAAHMGSVPASVFSLTKEQIRWDVRQRISEGEARFGEKIIAEWLKEERRSAMRDFISRTFKRDR